jgi:GTPase SAR1 family protein
MTAAFYNKAQGVVITFDVNRRESFQSLTQWITDVKMNAPQECFALLCANKTDCPEDLWEVSRNEYMEFSAMHKMPLYETSSKTGTNVTKMFVDMARKVMETDRDKLQQVQSPTQQISNIVLNEKNLRKKKKSGCCPLI